MRKINAIPRPGGHRMQTLRPMPSPEVDIREARRADQVERAERIARKRAENERRVARRMESRMAENICRNADT